MAQGTYYHDGTKWTPTHDRPPLRRPVGGGDAALPVDFSGVTVHSVNHRGYSSTAPENTIPAYIMSKEKGFTCVEADVAFTADGVAVLLHDSTIDRTSNGSGSISALTYAEVSKYDFGSWKSDTYAGTRIPTFAEFIAFCKNVGLHPYIELKNAATYTAAQIKSLVEMVNNCGMRGRVSWISFTAAYLGYVRDSDPAARLGYLVSSVTANAISTAQALQTGRNEVFMDSSDYDTDAVARCQAAGLPLEIWTINSQSIIESMDPYITGVTSDNLIAEEILREKAMAYDYSVTAVTVTAISAAYTGGNVAAGTPVDALNGLTVTATYSDGSTSPVTGYTLSGSIAEGDNTVTVTYQGKTATFTVTGIPGGAEEPDIAESYTISGDRLIQGGIVGDYSGHGSEWPYCDARTTRRNYPYWDIKVEAGATYRFEVDATVPVNIGVLECSQLVLDAVAESTNFGYTSGNEYVVDSGWKTAPVEITMRTEYPTKVVRFNFKRADSSNMTADDITEVRAYKVS